MTETPASRVIAKLGGPEAVASILGVHVTRVFAWRRERGKSGVAGRIPTQHQQALLDHARAHDIDLRPDDFFDPEPEVNATPPNAVRGEGAAAADPDEVGVSDEANTLTGAGVSDEADALTGASRAQVAA